MSEDATLDEFIKSEDTETDEVSTETPQELDLGPRSLNLPDQWGKTEFGTTFSHQRGVNYSSDNYVSEGEGMVFLTLNAIAPGGGLKKDSLKFYDDDIPDEKTTTEGDILMANTDLNQDGEIIGYPVRVPSFESDVQKCFSHHLLKIEQKQETYDSQFLEYLFSTDYIHERMIAFSCGSTVLNLNTDLLDSLELPLPPIDEQRKIATVLHNVDQAIQKTEEIESRIHQTKKGIIQDVLEHGLGDSETSDTGTKLGRIPTHWEVTTIENIVAEEENAFTDGARYSLSSAEIYEEGEARAILLQEVGEGEFNDEDPKFATEEKYEEITHRAIYPGEVVVAKMAEPVARACIVPEKYDKYLLGCADVVRVQTNNEFDERFLMYCMNSHKVWRQAVAHLRGTGRSRINLENIAELKLPKPPLKEQVEIADTLEQFDRRVENEQDYRDRLQRLKQGLMQDLLSGTVRTTDTNIEVPDEIAQHG